MKSTTDLHWNERALAEQEHVHVNLMDVYQRNVEFNEIDPYLGQDMKLLEIGCGNGYSTAHFRELVRHVDAFDYAENMVAQAKEVVGEKNNRFFVDNLLDPKSFDEDYDCAVCVRVLINLRNFDEQVLALNNIAKVLKPGGRLILGEGFREGFDQLNLLRNSLGLSDLKPAKINYYSSTTEFLPEIKKLFEIKGSFHLGMYDFLTRVLNPFLSHPEGVKHNTSFSEKAEIMSKHLNPDAFEKYSRIKGYVLEKK